MHVPLDVIVEFVDLNTGQGVAPGEPGEVVVTLLEETYPLLRFGTGDLAIYTDEPCPCGRTTRRITGIVGRVGQAVKVRGMFVHPRQATVALHDFPELARWQLVVTRAAHQDDIVLHAVLQPGVTVGPAWQETVAAALRAALKVRVDVTVVAEDIVPADAAPLVDRRTWE
jgi:phenylacetate-CoA ligase